MQNSEKWFLSLLTLSPERTDTTIVSGATFQGYLN